MKDITIHLLKGFCDLFFGDSPQRAITLFGEPNEKEELIDELFNEKSMVYHYWDHGFSLFFKNDENKGLHCVEVDNKEAVLLGEKLFALKEEDIISLFKKNAFPLSETEQHTWGEKRMSFDEAFADLYFEKGKLISINFCTPDYFGDISNLNLN
ncbi:MAG TPA: hypothetical protein VK835_01550 [Bacteroidia bacterium]|jgi:hypothetical protein|nr:hypothetical protein [Bacteroidia bacterium]